MVAEEFQHSEGILAFIYFMIYIHETTLDAKSG